MKRIISLLLALTMFASLGIGAVTTVGSESSDPADSYVAQEAEHEESAIQMWFSHSNVKVHQEDVESTGRDTYSIYMARNEYQGTNVTLYSPEETFAGITAAVTQFEAMDGSGATLDADVFYEYYIQCDDLDTTDVLEADVPAKSPIREGIIPEAIASISRINNKNGMLGKFTLTAGKTQTLYIKVRSTKESPSGWYSGQFNVIDSNGDQIKTATVYAYVWGFTIPDAIHFQTGIYMDIAGLSDDQYKSYYDYLLDNRICLMDPPGELNSSNPYLSDPRVTAYRVTHTAPGSYLGTLYNSTEIADFYDDISTLDNADEVKEKAYFYIADEPRSQQQKDYSPRLANPTVSDIKTRALKVKDGWGANPYILVTYDQNHPYPHGYDKDLAYDETTGTYLTEYDGSERFANIGDAVQGMMNDVSCTLWCVKTMAYTPKTVLESVGYNGDEMLKVRNSNGIISGFDCGNPAARYFDWDTRYGEFEQRIKNYQRIKRLQNKKIKVWTYECGRGPDYTYCNHLIENTGLQTELLFWQSMQLGATGYLYYGANYYSNHTPSIAAAVGSGNTYDGAMVQNGNVTYNGVTLPRGKWQVNRYLANGKRVYGNGVLLYDSYASSIVRLKNPNEPFGTIRIEHMRDGIEDYEMLYMYRELYGEEAMNSVIGSVSSNVACYLSLPGFDRTSWDPDMTNEDIFAEVRKGLGEAIEEGYEHEHVWDEGEIIAEPAVGVTGLRKCHCTVCGEAKTFEIPAIVLIPGDLDGDGIITSRDLRLLKLYLAGYTYFDSIVFPQNADLNEDGDVTAQDYAVLKGLIVS
ncbi:MAG: DUF4091 domain-containing protein [Clostridia bacterium]|nr:DUF4091 domain-containing protein [Clostridia bacterium]